MDMDKSILSVAESEGYDDLLRQVGDALEQGRRTVASAVNSAMLATYWEIGRYIVEYEQSVMRRQNTVQRSCAVFPVI